MNELNVGQIVTTNMPFNGTVVEVTKIIRDFDGNVLHYQGKVIVEPTVKQRARKTNRVTVGTIVGFLPNSVQ